MVDDGLLYLDLQPPCTYSSTLPYKKKIPLHSTLLQENNFGLKKKNKAEEDAHLRRKKKMERERERKRRHYGIAVVSPTLPPPLPRGNNGKGFSPLSLSLSPDRKNERMMWGGKHLMAPTFCIVVHIPNKK